MESTINNKPTIIGNLGTCKSVNQYQTPYDAASCQDLRNLLEWISIQNFMEMKTKYSWHPKIGN